MESPSLPLTLQLRDKALLALEDAVQECRYRTPRASFAVRFALAYLWVYRGGGDRTAFDGFWKGYRSQKSTWSFSTADRALSELYRALGVERPNEAGMAMWRRWHDEERKG